tara:strand:- start:254 stop:592 length:339 start_codon:yes stop_codon:yes gene_type:complete
MIETPSAREETCTWEEDLASPVGARAVLPSTSCSVDTARVVAMGRAREGARALALVAVGRRVAPLTANDDEVAASEAGIVHARLCGLIWARWRHVGDNAENLMEEGSRGPRL